MKYFISNLTGLTFLSVLKLILFSVFAAVIGCSSLPQNTESGRKPASVGEITQVKQLPSEVKIEDDLKSVNTEDPEIAWSNPRYASLSEAIKMQKDDKIFIAATEILLSQPNDVRALSSLAMYHYKKGSLDLALHLLNKAVAIKPRIADLYTNIGIIQLTKKEDREAIRSFRKALSFDLNEAVAAANLGSIYVKEKDWAKANVVLEIAIKMGLKDPRIFNNYAISLTAMGKYEKAQAIYLELINAGQSNSQLSPEVNKQVLFNYSILLIDRMSKFQEGIEVLNRLKFVGGPAELRNKIIALENKAKAGLK
jgi:Flp pilus assembly protein TadD